MHAFGSLPGLAPTFVMPNCPPGPYHGYFLTGGGCMWSLDTDMNADYTGEYWAQKARARDAIDSRGKQLRRDRFGLVKEHYGECISSPFILLGPPDAASWFSRVQAIPGGSGEDTAEAGPDEKEM